MGYSPEAAGRKALNGLVNVGRGAVVASSLGSSALFVEAAYADAQPANTAVGQPSPDFNPNTLLNIPGISFDGLARAGVNAQAEIADKQLLSFFETGDSILKPQTFGTKLDIRIINFQAELDEAYKNLKGESAKSPAINPDQAAFLVVDPGIQGKSLALRKVSIKDGHTVVEVEYRSTSTDKNYTPEGKSRYIAGVGNKDMVVEMFYGAALEPFSKIGRNGIITENEQSKQFNSEAQSNINSQDKIVNLLNMGVPGNIAKEIVQINAECGDCVDVYYGANGNVYISGYMGAEDGEKVYKRLLTVANSYTNTQTAYLFEPGNEFAFNINFSVPIR